MLGRFPLLNLFHSCESLAETKQLHALLITAPLSPHSSLAANLLRSYAANDDIRSAHLLFDQTPHQTIYLWNSIIRAHARRREFLHAFSLFARLRISETNPDNYTFACILRACSENSDPPGARTAHGLLISSGLSSDQIASSALVSAYSKLRLVDDARRLFDGMPQPDLVLWNSMISGYGYGGVWQKGLELFHRMRNSGEKPDGYSIVGLISCFWDPGALQISRGIHGICLKGGYDYSDHVRSALVTMYSRCKCLESGYQIFRALPQPDLVTWSALITGFSQVGKCGEALTLFSEMTSSGKAPDPILIASILSACASMATIKQGKEIHSFVFRHGLVQDIAVSCALIDTYSKCGFAEMGLRVFGMMTKKNLITYNALISGLGSHGLGREAINVFEELLNSGFKPEEATFSALLCACCHSGFMEDARELFRRMERKFGMKPQMEHYVYMVKLLGSVGMLEEAYDLVRTMPMLPDSGVWGALLWACGAHGRLDLGEIVARRLFEIDPSKTAYRIMLSNLYAAEEKWGDVENLRDEMMGGGLLKIPGCSWIGDCSG